MKTTLLLTFIALLAGCGTVDKQRARLPGGPPPIPQLKAEPRQKAVVFPELVPVVFAWESAGAGWVDFYAYYGWSEDSITNVFGTTRGLAITNHVFWPHGAEDIHGVVYAQNAFGRSDPSYIARLPDWPADAVRLDSIPQINAQVMLWQSPNGTHWAGSYIRLPATNSITQPAVFYMIAPVGAGSSEQTPVTLTIEPLRLTKRSYSGG